MDPRRRNASTAASKQTPTTRIPQQEPLRARVLLSRSAIALHFRDVGRRRPRSTRATRGEARSSRRGRYRVPQSLDGGFVSEILVREGQIVQPEQMLLAIDETRFCSR